MSRDHANPVQVDLEPEDLAPNNPASHTEFDHTAAANSNPPVFLIIW
jgi:hypothetical protein